MDGDSNVYDETPLQYWLGRAVWLNVYNKLQCVLEKGIGPALKFAGKDGGIALTTIELANLDDEENELDDTV